MKIGLQRHPKGPKLWTELLGIVSSNLSQSHWYVNLWTQPPQREYLKYLKGLARNGLERIVSIGPYST